MISIQMAKYICLKHIFLKFCKGVSVRSHRVIRYIGFQYKMVYLQKKYYITETSTTFQDMLKGPNQYKFEAAKFRTQSQLKS